MKMGRIFPLTLLLQAFATVAFCQGGKILLPEKVQVKPPPSRGEAGAKEDYDRRRKQLDQRLDIKRKPKPSPSEELNKELIKEVLKPVEIKYSLNVHLLASSIQTSGNDRDGYYTDPSAGFMLLIKPFKSSDSSSLSMWTGLRSYYFLGGGKYKNNNGRFSFNYIGPTIGIGKIDPGINALPKKDNKAAEVEHGLSHARNGYFALMGIAAQSRQGKAEDGKEDPTDDLNTKSIAFDSPGLWAEIWYSRIKYNAISVNVLAGVQMGKGKTFYYAGLGTGGWR